MEAPELLPVKVCKYCKQSLPASAFYRHKLVKSGLTTGCRECVAKMRRASHLRVVYGITPEEYDELLRIQNGVCAICGGTEATTLKVKSADRKRAPRQNMDTLKVDHDHITGKVRGLLCSGCNVAIGGFRDDIEAMRKAIAYLEAHVDD